MRILRHFKRHLFLYFFLLVQAIFLIWVISGAVSTSNSGAQAHAQALRECAGTGWQPLYSSYHDCVTNLGNLYSNASSAGKGIGVGLVIALWVVFDVVLMIGRIVVLLSRRGNRKSNKGEGDE
jgi:hypothetical protein